MRLHYKEFGEGEPLIILHGLMGMLDNLQGVAKKLSETFHVFVLDQRNHGHSPHSDVFSYESMSNDLLEFIEERGFHEIYLLGHSMGGKTAMKFAQNHPDYVKKLIVVDIAPKAYPVHHQSILEGLNSIDFEIVKSRSEAENILEKYVPNYAERQFLLKNMYWKDKGHLAWRFNLEAITKNIIDIGEEINDRLFDKPTLFIGGGNSNYITQSDFDAIKITFSHADFKIISNASHWVHADNPVEFVDSVVAFLS